MLLIIGTHRRIRGRLEVIWVPKSTGRPSVSGDIIDLIIDMKRQNLIWGAIRISQELKHLGISNHKKTVQRILKEFGFTPPKLKFPLPSRSGLI